MTGQSPNPAIGAEAVRRALGQADPPSGDRAELDAAELRELERSLYYGETAVSSNPGAAPDAGATQTAPSTRRSLIARLFRRG
jgi:hypothetical protein